MNASKNGINLIISFEGFRSQAYLCPANIWTIGYGTTKYPNGKSVKKADTCTKEQATSYLKNDLKKFENVVTKKVDVELLNQNMFDALVSFAYNTGTVGNTMASKLTKGDYEGCADAMLEWNKATVNGVKQELAGLTRRRKAERELFLKDYKNAITKIKKDSDKSDIKKLQTELNKIDVGLKKLTVDGGYGKLTQQYLLAVWEKWNWNKDNSSNGWTAGKKSLTKLGIIE